MRLHKFGIHVLYLLETLFVLLAAAYLALVHLWGSRSC